MIKFVSIFVYLIGVLHSLRSFPVVITVEFTLMSFSLIWDSIFFFIESFMHMNSLFSSRRIPLHSHYRYRILTSIGRKKKSSSWLYMICIERCREKKGNLVRMKLRVSLGVRSDRTDMVMQKAGKSFCRSYFRLWENYFKSH